MAMRRIHPLPSASGQPRAWSARRCLLGLACGGLFLAARPSPAVAQHQQASTAAPSAPSVASYHYQRDRIDVRLYAGFAYFMGQDRYTTDPRYYLGSQPRHRTHRGLGVGYGASLGTAIVPNLIMYGEIVGSSISHPAITNNVDSEAVARHVHQVALGVGIAYFFEPSHGYFSSALTLPRAWFDYSSSSGFGYYGEKTNLGVGVNLRVGREWWVSDAWALGLAAQAHLATMGYPIPDPSVDADLRLYSATFALLFSAAHE
jgi:hypothetical protein